MIPLRRADPPPLPPGFEPRRYELTHVTSGIVHLGLGGFHRAHMARYTHDLMGGDPAALAWGITGAGLRDADRPLLATLAAQDGLYSLVEREGVAEQRAVIGSLVATIDASNTSAALLAAVEAPATRIVSATVTENGYHLDRATKTLDLAHPAIAADLADLAHPRTVPGVLVEAYRRRRATRAPAFTALCCDNIQHNGHVLRDVVLAFAERRDPALAAWIAREARFPNTMVDRITPVPTAESIAAFRAETGLDDGAPLHAELFRQWVIEDDFADGRPAWEKVGAQFVGNVAPYEFMKLRLLNTSHLAIAGLGQLAGYMTIGETIADPLIRRFMIALMDRETGPTVPAVPGIDLAAYKASLVARFANPAIRDTTQRINTDAPLNYLLEPTRDRLAAGAPIDLLALGIAAWCRRVAGVGERGEAIEVVHPLTDLLARRAREGGSDPRALLSIRELFGDVGADPQLIASVAEWLKSLYAGGARATLKAGAARDLF